MARTQTTFDALGQLARDLGIRMISGALQPPDGGRLYLGGRSLSEILLPDWAGRPVALAVIAGGPPHEHAGAGTALLGREALARLTAAVSEASGHVYYGRLSELRPADWLRRHGKDTSQAVQATSATQMGWRDNLENAETAGLGTGPTLEAARAAGWPAAFADEPVLFLDDEPVYYLLMRENTGRDVALLVAGLDDTVDRSA
jgi:hypothetical protein